MNFLITVLLLKSTISFAKDINFSPNSTVKYINSKPIEVHTDLTIYAGPSKQLLSSICKGHSGNIEGTICRFSRNNSFSYIDVKNGPKKLKKISIINSRSSLTENEINKAVE